MEKVQVRVRETRFGVGDDHARCERSRSRMDVVLATIEVAKALIK